MPLYGAHIPRQQEYPPPAFLPQCQPVNSSYLSISHIQGVQFLSNYITYYGLTTHVFKTKGSCATSLTRATLSNFNPVADSFC